VETIGNAISAMNAAAGGQTQVVAGVQVLGNDTSGMAAALDAVQWADVVVLAVGLDDSWEGEGLDRPDTSLPGVQEPFALKVLAAGKPTVLVMVNGGMISIDNLVAPAPAIVEAFYPSTQGAVALTSLLFGESNRFGRMPVTIYPASFAQTVDMNNMSMHTGPGRTYRYYTGEPLFAFGHGLSYTTFQVTCTNASSVWGVSITCTVANVGSRDGDDVVLLYHVVGDDIRAGVDHPVPIHALVDFDRVSVARGASATVSFEVGDRQLAITNADGLYVVYPGSHSLCVRDGGDADLWCTTVVVTEAVHADAVTQLRSPPAASH
jgi:hypothetical protein